MSFHSVSLIFDLRGIMKLLLHSNVLNHSSKNNYLADKQRFFRSVRALSIFYLFFREKRIKTDNLNATSYLRILYKLVIKECFICYSLFLLQMYN